ncbi:MAG: WhiB family transcriptional regulator [Actinobacteria bacterium]|nr:WhiB family transcriptional regulator [Actinomycetota bacterium]
MTTIPVPDRYDDWQDEAECRGTELDMWFDDARQAECAAICARCWVVDECLADAVRLETGQTPYGFRGGKTAAQRLKERRAKTRARK